MVVIASMLQHCRLVLTKSIDGGRCVLLEAGSCSAFSLTNIPAWAWCRVSSSAGDVVDNAGLLLFRKLVFGLDKTFSERSARCDGGGETLVFEQVCQWFR